MADFCASVAANTLGNLATEYISPYVGYFFRFGKIIKEFNDRRDELGSRKAEVQGKVEEAGTRNEVIEKVVEDWLTKVDEELEEARNLVREIESGSNCLKWCPNWGWRCCLSKKVAKKTLSISKLLETSNFEQVSRPAPFVGMEFVSSKDNFLPSESSEAALNRIMNALKSDDVYMVGLYGMPGVGKTTLAIEVGKKSKEHKLFDKVVMFTVSKDPNINNIQGKIAQILELQFQPEENALPVRAEKLWNRLKGEKKILIIVDDVWAPLDFASIGIPFGVDHVGCKILLTTRLQRTCNQMDCQKKFPLETLSECEAWDLFEKNARPDSTLDEVAKEVAGECKGLPLAIVTVGRALKGQTDRRRWEAVHQRLKESRHSENQDVCGDIYSRLEISYECLEGKNSRRCLHLCSLFPEDCEIRIQELTTYGIGQGMFDDVDSIEKARTEMHDIVTKLQESGLLLGTGDAGFVKMHDVVRDFIHWKTSKGEDMFLVRSGLTTWPRNRSLGSCTAISLINCKINEFPDRLEFPKLKAFLLDGEQQPKTWDITLRFPSTFLQGMKVLEVLVLQNVFVSLESLPSLSNLRTLRLRSCELKDASSLGNLEKLEILVISNYSFQRVNYEELFRGLTGLTTLKLLDISDFFSDEAWTLPKNLLSRIQYASTPCFSSKWTNLF